MAEDDKKDDPIDIDTLSDEDFMKLDVPPEVVEKTEENHDDTTGNADSAQAAADAAAATAGSGDASEGSDAGTGEDGQEGEGADGAGGGEEGEGTGGSEQSALTDEEKAAAALAAEDQTPEEKAAAALAATEAAKGANADKETLKLKKEGEEDDDKDGKKAAAEDAVAAQEVAKTFFDKVSAPFKADGKDVQIRTPEEAIRLMQMGVNYSRRMKEMKPLREMDAMLTQHGLNDPMKLNELIDLSKGSKEAVQKFLAKHKIDPLDLDVSKADEHKTPNYRSDPKDVAFQEAIDDTLQANGGKELLGDINRDWDDQSKEALRENSSIFGKLLEQKDTGVYEQINKELLHQRTMGYLAGVPFLQAYEQVGNAMQKAGVFEKEVQKTGLAPIGSGSRKAPAKKPDPTPNLSSANKTAKAASDDAASKEPDYLSMSDEDFMKMAQPA